MKNLNFEGSFIQLSTNEETGFIRGRRLKTIHHLSLSTRRCLFERRDVDLFRLFFQTRLILEKIIKILSTNQKSSLEILKRLNLHVEILNWLG